MWLTPEEGGRSSGPPQPSADADYAQTAFVPPRTVDSGLASFALRDFDKGAWVSPAEGRWLVIEDDGDQFVRPGSVIVCTEGHRVVAYFHVEQVAETPT